MDLQDFDKGVDFTGLGTQTAAEHNQLVDQGEPHGDSATEGKGIVLWTVDAVLDTPAPPDPTLGVNYNKWMRYIWLRIPHATATDQTPILYGWNDAATSDPTFLKWIATIDITGLEADINTALANASSAQTTANNANTTAGTAATNAATALTTANAASVTAASAASDAAQATSDAATAQSTANTALSTAQAANAPKTPAGALTVGTPGQKVRTNAAGTSAEWVSQGIIQKLVKVTNTASASTGTQIPYDNTIPEITEGTEYVTQAITPVRADSLIHIHFEAFVDKDANGAVCVALFQVGATNALKAVAVALAAAGREHCVSLDFWVAAGSVTARTYSIRYGPDSNIDTAYMNRSSAGARFGGVAYSFFVVEEVFGTIA